VGEGSTCLVFPRGDVPAPTDVALDAARAVPTAMVTGTNGKTTSSRLLAWMARAEGHVVGLTSSDGALIDDEVLASGDFTGPAAARLVLRDRRVTFAVLETARGGILRRGLARSRCDVALLTNVSADHLGGYGVDDLADMTAVKAVVARAAEKAVVLNAADPSLLALAKTLNAELVFFADGDDRPETRATIDAHRARGGAVTFTRAGEIVHARGEHETSIFAVDRAPITYGGSARYNVENALGATAAALAMGLSVNAVIRGLATFGPAENPGRGEVVEKDGVHVVLDFAHNAEGARALRALVDSLRARDAGRLTVIAGSPGDRSDDDVRALARAVLEMRPDHVLVRELSHYLRGRSLGEIPALFRGVVEPAGVPFAEVESEVAGIDRALASARPGDVIALLAHVDRDEVRGRLRP
jgi:UDP-N-acetylmuramyl tripeptide synthase